MVMRSLLRCPDHLPPKATPATAQSTVMGPRALCVLALVWVSCKAGNPTFTFLNCYIFKVSLENPTCSSLLNREKCFTHSPFEAAPYENSDKTYTVGVCATTELHVNRTAFSKHRGAGLLKRAPGGIDGSEMEQPVIWCKITIINCFWSSVFSLEFS